MAIEMCLKFRQSTFKEWPVARNQEKHMFACSGCCRDDATNATTRFSKDCGAISFYSQTPCIDNWLEVETIPLKKLQLVKSPNELRGISILETFAEDIDGNVHHVSKNECNVLT